MSQPFEQFGKYILLEKLASGGMAEVFLAKSNGANGVSKFLAIKRILPQYSDNEDFIEMFKEEAKIAVNLNHGNVVSIYDFGIEQNQFYLVMEYVEGRNLRQVINEFKKRSISFSTEQVVYIIKEVAAGLDHAHRCLDGSTGRPLNITHRDMSPQNVMVSFEGEVKVIDFGIAKAETQMAATKAGTLKGKFGYMSPEQSEGLPVDLRTDVFSLGIVLWELLTSERLFLANSEGAILRKIKECNIPSIRKINPSVPIELERIANRALAKDKALRYQTGAQMHKDLNRFLNTEYPEFSPQEFSVFIKNNFSEIYVDSKRKLVDYAKVRMAQPEERSMVTQTMTLVTSQDSDSAALLPSFGGSPDENQNQTKGIKGIVNEVEASEGHDMIVDLEGLKTHIGLPPHSRTRASSIVDSNTGFRAGDFSRSGASIRLKEKKTNRSFRSRRSVDLTSLIGYLLIFGILTGSGFFFFSKTKVSEAGSTILASLGLGGPTPPPPPIVDPPKPPPPVSPELYSVTINSEPTGADIIIDGRDTKESTPARLNLQAGKLYSLRLDKAGYYSNTSTFQPSNNGYSVKIMLVQGRFGYLNLDVINGGADPIVEIDGRQISAQLPLNQYKVPAGVPLRIRVSNAFSQLSEERTVMIKENERHNLHLVLTRHGSRQ